MLGLRQAIEPISWMSKATRMSRYFIRQRIDASADKKKPINNHAVSIFATRGRNTQIDYERIINYSRTRKDRTIESNRKNKMRAEQEKEGEELNQS